MIERLVLLDRGAQGAELLCPELGRWSGGPAVGALLGPGQRLGRLEQLGAPIALIVPEGVSGRVVEVAPPGPLAYGQRLIRLAPIEVQAAGLTEAGPSAQGPVFSAPMSGRFYARPAPDQPPFVQPGEVLAPGATVCLLEVMKTFNRVHYGGAGLPERGRVLQLLVEDGADVEKGQAILRVEPA